MKLFELRGFSLGLSLEVKLEMKLELSLQFRLEFLLVFKKMTLCFLKEFKKCIDSDMFCRIVKYICKRFSKQRVKGQYSEKTSLKGILKYKSEKNNITNFRTFIVDPSFSVRTYFSFKKLKLILRKDKSSIRRSPEKTIDEFIIEEESSEVGEFEGGVVVFDEKFQRKTTDLLFTKGRHKDLDVL